MTGGLLRGVGALTLTALALTEAPAQAPVAVGGPRVWQMDVRAEQGWESNVRFARPDDPGDAVSRAGVGVTGALQTGLTRLAVSARGDLSHFQHLSGLDQSTYGFAAGMTHAFTPRLAVDLGALARTSLSRDVVQIGQVLTLLPFALTRSYGGTGSAAYRLTPQTTGSLSATYTRVGFDIPTLAGGSSATGRASLLHRYGVDDAYGVGYELQRNTTVGRSHDSHTLDLSWQPTVGSFSARLRAGATALRAPPGTDVRRLSALRATGEATLRRRFAEGAAGVYYRRAVGQAFGLGRVLSTDQAGASIDRVLRRGLTFRADGSESWSTDPTGPALRLRYATATAELQERVHPLLSVAVGAFVRERVASDVVSARGLRLTVLCAAPRR